MFCEESFCTLRFRSTRTNAVPTIIDKGRIRKKQVAKKWIIQNIFSAKPYLIDKPHSVSTGNRSISVTQIFYKPKNWGRGGAGQIFVLASCRWNNRKYNIYYRNCIIQSRNIFISGCIWELTTKVLRLSQTNFRILKMEFFSITNIFIESMRTLQFINKL